MYFAILFPVMSVLYCVIVKNNCFLYLYGNKFSSIFLLKFFIRLRDPRILVWCLILEVRSSLFFVVQIGNRCPDVVNSCRGIQSADLLFCVECRWNVVLLLLTKIHQVDDSILFIMLVINNTRLESECLEQKLVSNPSKGWVLSKWSGSESSRYSEFCP